MADDADDASFDVGIFGDNADGAKVDDGILISLLADGATVVDDTDGADGATVVDGILIPLLADEEDDGILIPLLADDADGATVDGSILVDDTNCVMVDEGSVDDADGALIDEGILVDDTNCVNVDEGSVDDADGALIDEGISVGGEEHEVLVLVPIGGGVVDVGALASTTAPVEAGTC